MWVLLELLLDGDVLFPDLLLDGGALLLGLLFRARHLWPIERGVVSMPYGAVPLSSSHARLPQDAGSDRFGCTADEHGSAVVRWVCQGAGNRSCASHARTKSGFELSLGCAGASRSRGGALQLAVAELVGAPQTVATP